MNQSGHLPILSSGPPVEIDPVCGMKVDPARAAATVEHGGRTYFFCSRGCAEKFQRDPAKYLSSPPLSAPNPHADALQPIGTTNIFTCPMHPEVRHPGPGSCPICGMALEPRTVTAEEETNPELVDMSRRFWLSLALSVPVLILAMADLLPGKPLARLVSPGTNGWLQFLLASPVVLWGGWPFFVRGWTSIVNRRLNMFTLIAIGVGVAYFYSVAALLIPDAFPEAFRMAGGQVAGYFEAAAAITTLVLLGQVLELRARSHTGARDQGAARLGAENGSACSRRWHGKRCAARERSTGRPAPRAPRRKNSGRWNGARGLELR